MSEFHTTRRLVSGSEIDFSAEAARVQSRAARGQPSVIRLGALLFFSTRSGDAWMLDVQDGEAACLASAGEPRPAPIIEADTTAAVAWPSRYRIDGDAFVVIEKDGSTRSYLEYPLAEIRPFLVDDAAESPGSGAANAGNAAERLRRTGRNDPCPCGSGRKYKKCCLSADEAAVADTRKNGPRMERHDTVPDKPDDLDLPVADEFDEPEATVSGDDEPAIAPEIRAAADQIWAEFDQLRQPGPGDVDSLLDHLLALPPGATNWADTFDAIEASGHADMPAVFRRLASALPSTKAADASFFFWHAMEKFVSKGRDDLVPEIAGCFRRLDQASYDADALHHVVLWALAAGHDAEALALDEHFLPILRDDPDIMPHVVPAVCRSIFELRIGRRLPELGECREDREALAREVYHDLHDGIDPLYARFAARLLRGEAASAEFHREDFALALAAGTEATADDLSAEAKRHFALLARIAHDAWRHRGRSPGAAFRGLTLMVDAILDEEVDRRRRRNSQPRNLLDCLHPSGMERRIAQAARGLMDTNVPHAHLLIEAHADLLDFAQRHRLIAENDATKAGRNIAALRGKLGFRAGRGDSNC